MPKILKQMIRRKINVVVKVIFKYNMLFILMSGNYIYNSIFINKKIIKIIIFYLIYSIQK